MDTSHHAGSVSRRPRRERLRTSKACQLCRLRKAKCDGARPVCARCNAKGETCTYGPGFVGILRKHQGKHQPPVDTPRSLGSVLTASPTAKDAQLETPSTRQISTRIPAKTNHLHGSEDADADTGDIYYHAHGQFAGEVASAIGQRTGHTEGEISHLVPFVDAPLFEDPNLLCQANNGTVDHEMLPRAYTDRLVGIYWQHVDPIEPVLDRAQFFQNYELWHSIGGGLRCADRDVQLSIFYVVFALAVQRQESIPQHPRNQEATRYFQRAWALLQPEGILCKESSIEVVQCLMLLNRYLHCTNNQEKTWMTAGTATRMAQNMCGRFSTTSPSENCSQNWKIKERVLTSCIALERCVSWSLGRTAAPPMVSIPSWSGYTPSSGNDAQSNGHEEHVSLVVEFNEIANQIQLAQIQANNPVAARLGLPRPYYQGDYYGVAIQLDECLKRLENSLRPEWKSKNLQDITDPASRVGAYLVNLRLLHYRIILYRPMLVRLYLRKSHATTEQASPNNATLDDRLIKKGASLCVEAAQKLASLTIETMEPYEAMGLLPWWYRVYYLHIAATNFLAAMLSPDLSTESVSQSWQNVMSALHGHEHLSSYISQCIWMFEKLSAKILNARYSGPDDTNAFSFNEDPPYLTFDNILQELDLKLDPFQLTTDIFEN